MKSMIGVWGFAFGTVLLVSGCNKKADAGPAGGGSAAASATGATSAMPSSKPFMDPSDDPSPASAAMLPTGTPVSAKTLARFDEPKPKKAPAHAIWTTVWAEKDGDKFTNLTDFKANKKIYMTLRFIDCRADKVKTYAGKPLKDTGEFGFCFVTLPEKFKDYPSWGRDKGGGNNSTWDALRVVRAGNVIVTVSGDPSWKLAGIDEALTDMDWATIAKW
jgi:hypothetical protein